MPKYRAIRTNTAKDGRTYFEGTVVDLHEDVASHHFERVGEDFKPDTAKDAEAAKMALSEMMNTAKPPETAGDRIGKKFQKKGK